jgi:nicotinic acid mononucleotide adenylyltransferase
MYVYPTSDPVTGEVQSLERSPAPPPWHHLRALLLEIGRIEAVRGYDESYLSIRSPDILARIQSGDASWEKMVPDAVAEIIKAENLFGWRPRQG